MGNISTKNQQVQRRLTSLCKYTDALIKSNSKLDVIRLDLGYKIENRGQLTPDQVSNDLNTLYTNSRSNSIFKDLKGYIFKLECGKDNNYHVHSIFFLDGNKNKDIITAGENIGKYWNNNITNNQGYYSNRNMEEYKDDGNGIGRIDYQDADKVSKLKDNVLPYFAKSTTDIVGQSGIVKSLRKGVLPKEEKRGRPRKVLLQK